jgi:uncharacterized protein (TIGR02611 family)
MIDRVRERRDTHKQRGRTYRVAFGTLGFSVLASGIVLSLPFVPGPGLLLIAVGLGMLALEFAWAEHLLERVLNQLEEAGERAARASGTQKAVATAVILAGAAVLATAAFLWDLPLLPV